MDEVVITVENVSKDFVLPHEKVSSVKGLFTSLHRRRSSKEVQHALKNVSFEVKKGEFFGIVGRNGSGKSTMLKMLAGIYQPSTGKIAVDGKLVPFIELGVGFNPELTGRENVYLNGAMMGFSKKETDEIYDEIVEFAELEKFMDQRLKNYSSGMQVRLAFSVAVKVDADILLIDEVLAVGDAAFQRKCYDYFKSLKKNGKTVVFVTHDMGAVRQFCDRAALIEANELQAVGDPTKIADSYEKLFYSKLEPASTTTDRWGDGSVKFAKLGLSKKTLEDTDKTLELSMVLQAKDNVSDSKSFLAGFRVMNATGQCVYEINTRDLGIKLPAMKPGDKKSIKWECPNIHVDGSYSVDVFINHDGQIADAQNDALRFNVNRPRLRGGFLVAPSIKAKVE